MKWTKHKNGKMVYAFIGNSNDASSSDYVLAAEVEKDTTGYHAYLFGRGSIFYKWYPKETEFKIISRDIKKAARAAAKRILDDLS